MNTELMQITVILIFFCYIIELLLLTIKGYNFINVYNFLLDSLLKKQKTSFNGI